MIFLKIELSLSPINQNTRSFSFVNVDGVRWFLLQKRTLTTHTVLLELYENTSSNFWDCLEIHSEAFEKKQAFFRCTISNDHITKQ